MSWVKAWRMKGDGTGEEVVKALKEIAAYYGTCSRITTDQGSAFMGDIMQKYIQDNRISHRVSS